MAAKLPQKPTDGTPERRYSSAETRNLILKKARTSRKVSWLLDECIRIPGTKLRFGLDPLLGLFPYGGETVATIVGTIIIGEAGKKGLPVKTLVRMGGNMLLNAGLGVMPVVGDLFSFWFKSNTRNYRLLNAYLESDHGAEEPAPVVRGGAGRDATQSEGA